MVEQEESAENAKSGGRRPGSGRKPIPDRGQLKTSVNVYVEKKKVDKLGGKERLKQAVVDFINELYTSI